jgi:hypothetical protein
MMWEFLTCPLLYTICTLMIPPQTPGVNLALFADDMYICDRPQGGLCSEKDPAWARLYGGLV